MCEVQELLVIRFSTVHVACNQVTFQVFTVGSKKMTFFLVVAPWSLVEGDHPDYGVSKHLWNVGKLLPDYTAQQPRRQQSSYL
jgi:hypothetical protein